MTGHGYGRVVAVGKNKDRYRVDVRGRYVGTFLTSEEAEERRKEYAATLPPPRHARGGARPRPLRGHIMARMTRDGARYTAMLRGKSLGARRERKEAQALLDDALLACNQSASNAQYSDTASCATAEALSV